MTTIVAVVCRHVLLVFDLLLVVLPYESIGTAQPSSIHFLCVSDPMWNPSSARVVGYTSTSISLPGFDRMEFRMVLPADWSNDDCCRRVQIRFDNDLLDKTTDSSVFFPYLEWTPCGHVMTHVICYSWMGDNRGVDNYWDFGSWWITVQDCVTQDSSEIGHDIVTFGEGSNILNPSSPRWSGKLRVEELAVPGTGPFMEYRPAPGSRGLVCVMDGVLLNNRAWYGHLETIEIGILTSLSYNFEFSLAQPSNAEIFTVYFYTSEESASVDRQMQCDNQTSADPAEASLNSLKGWGAGDSHKTLALSISNAWSGCRIENKAGRPTYICQGGRNFPDGVHEKAARVLRMGVSSCQYPHSGIRLLYRLEFMNSQGACPGHTKSLHHKQAAQTSHVTSAASFCQPFNQRPSACPLIAITAPLLLHFTATNIAGHFQP